MHATLANLRRRVVSAMRGKPAKPNYANDWPARIRDVCLCPDNPRITRHSAAGSLVDGFQVMHNGQLVKVDGYYGEGITEMLQKNQGCHEPQEEYVFQEVLRRINGPAHMLELGAYWSFYSMWFLQRHPERVAWMVEPELQNLSVGVENFQRNGLVGSFTSAFVGAEPGLLGGIPQISVDAFCLTRNIERLAILHADVQGAELEMLQGAKQMLGSGKTDYVFVSTHSDDLHVETHRLLSSYGFRIDCDVPPRCSYSYDGVIAAVYGSRLEQPLPQPSLK